MTPRSRWPWFLAAVGALWVGICIPQLRPWPKTEAEWSYFIPPVNFDDVLYYTAQLRYALDNGHVPGNTYLKEHDNDPFFQPAGNEAVLSLLARPFGTRLRASYIELALLYSIAIFALAWAIVSTFGLEGSAAWLGTALLIAVPEKNLNRMIHPQADAFLLLLLVFLAARKIWTGRAPWLWAAIGGITAGSLSFIYPFHGLFSDVLVSCLLGMCLLRRDRRAGPFFLFVGLAGILTLPYAFHNHVLGQLPQYPEILVRNGFLKSHFPTIAASGLMILSCAATFLSAPEERPFFWAAFLAALACLDMNVLTGNYLPMVAEHFRTDFFLPVALLAIVLLSRYAASFVRRAGAAMAVVAAILFLVYQSSLATAPGEQSLRESATAYAPAIAWLQAHAAPGSVGVSESMTASMITAFTPLRAYTGIYDYVSITTDAELQDRKFRELRLFGLAPSSFPSYALSHPIDLWGYGPISKYERIRAHNHFRKWLHRPLVPTPDGAVSDEELHDMSAAYAKTDADAGTGPYEADYLIYGPWEKESFPAFTPANSELTEVFKDSQVQIFAIRHTPTKTP